jgi:hypothetical protein
MKLLNLILLGTALVASSAAFGHVQYERNAPAQTASYAMPEGNTPAQIAAYPEPEGHTQPQIAFYFGRSDDGSVHPPS